MLKPSKKITLYEKIVTEIINRITSGEWVEGKRIPGQHALAKEFDVSRNCLREALKVMTSAGILIVEQGRGTFVAKDVLKKLSSTRLLDVLNYDVSLIELMEARTIIEVELAGLAAERATLKDKQRLQSAFEQLERDTHEDNRPGEAGFLFHLAIAEAANNKILSRLISSITEELKFHREEILEWENYEEMLEDHRGLLYSIINGNAKEARKIMYRHLKHTMDTIIQDEKDFAGRDYASFSKAE
jgi:GntR family transcriptional repressor for pyruvate dehydrogenase complex